VDCAARTVLTTEDTNFPAGDNLIIASVQYSKTTGQVGTRATGGIYDSVGLLEANPYPVLTSPVSSSAGYTMLAKDTSAPANESYTVEACLNLGSNVDAEAKIVVLSGMDTNAYAASGVVNLVASSDVTVVSIFTGNSYPAGDNIVIASVMVDSQSTAGTLAAGNIKLVRDPSGTPTTLADNEFAWTMISNPVDKRPILLIGYDTGAPGSQTYGVTINSPSSVWDAQATILTFQSPEAYFDNSGSKAISTGGVILASVSSSFASGTEIVAIAANHFEDTDSAIEAIPAVALTEAGIIQSRNQYVITTVAAGPNSVSEVAQD